MINCVQTVPCSVQCTRQRASSMTYLGCGTGEEYSGVRQAWAVTELFRGNQTHKMIASNPGGLRDRARSAAAARRYVYGSRVRTDAREWRVGTTRLRLQPPSGPRRADGRRHTPHAPPAAPACEPACGVCTLKRPAQACADQHAPRRSRSQGIETCSAQSLDSSPRRPRMRLSHLCR